MNKYTALIIFNFIAFGINAMDDGGEINRNVLSFGPEINYVDSSGKFPHRIIKTINGKNSVSYEQHGTIVTKYQDSYSIVNQNLQLKLPFPFEKAKQWFNELEALYNAQQELLNQ